MFSGFRIKCYNVVEEIYSETPLFANSHAGISRVQKQVGSRSGPFHDKGLRVKGLGFRAHRVKALGLRVWEWVD